MAKDNFRFLVSREREKEREESIEDCDCCWQLSVGRLGNWLAKAQPFWLL